jgi:feruloyl-CoA synthase
MSAKATIRGTSERLRPVRLRTSSVSLELRPDGSMLVRPEEPLGNYLRVLTDRLVHWAEVTPKNLCVAKRNADGKWRRFTYSQVLAAVRSIGQALLDRRLSAERPVVILSENDIEHFLLMLAGQHVGVPTAHLSPVYSLVSTDLAKLRHAVHLLKPGLLFVSDGMKYQRAISAVANEDMEIVVTANPPQGLSTTLFDGLLATTPTLGVERAHDRIAPADVAKILFTSGSTGLPKGVINTHRMLCCNQQMIVQVFPFLQDEPPVLVDWLPWNHTFGGNHNIGIALYNGGAYYIDDGKPGPGAIQETVRNLREIPPTVYFNVPKGYEDLLPFLRQDVRLRKTFFHKLRMLFYAGAGLSQPVWDAYRELSVETCGERVIMVTGLGATETAPMAIQTTWETDRAGVIGIPIPGVELKLVPREAKLEARVRGPNITPGYWKQPELTRAAFDEEGFYKFGDAIRFVDPHDAHKGFYFDGRFSEDFKLASGTWVSVGPLRAKILSYSAPLVRDVVVTGHDRDEIGVLIFADPLACCSLSPELRADFPIAEILRHQAVRARFRALLDELAVESTGTSNRVTRAILVEEPPSLDAGEVTDKGSLNQRAVLEDRAALVEELYAEPASPRILRITRI